MRDYTKFRKKMIATHLVPEQLDGYDYQYYITQEHRNDTGLLDTNPVFQGQVVAVKEIVGAEYPYVVFAKVSLIDEGIPDKQNYTDYENSQELTLFDTFLPETKDTIVPSVGQIVYLSYSDANNRLGGVYIAPVKTFDFVDTVINGVGEILKQGVAKLFNSGQQVMTNGMKGSCVPDYSNCSSETKGTGEYEIKFGDVRSYGFAKMVILDFNPKKNILVQEKAYKSLQRMFQDAKNEGLNLRINSGFRSYETQECFYRSYKSCLDEWKRSGADSSTKPPPAGNPKQTKNTLSSHMNGLAVDFNTSTNRSQNSIVEIFNMANTNTTAEALEETKKRLDLGKISTTNEWKWLINNSEKYGWIWSGIKFREPWHFHFDENLAKKNNMV